VTTPNDTSQVDTGIACLVALARFHQIAADPHQIKHHFGQAKKPFDLDDSVRAARAIGLKARRKSSNWAKLEATPLPAIIELVDQQQAILARADPSFVLVQRIGCERAEKWAKQEFEARWSGELILIARRFHTSKTLTQFDFSWFFPFILKYKKYLFEVLLASFFLQIFALITPLFFQVVIDKVLGHHGLTTLNVLAFGLFVVFIFEAALGGLRTYIFAHTTNRIDVALGSDLFRHLLRLPIAYFEARRVGDTVARVRELETIRNFITGSAVTVLIDSLFTLVFFAVMYLYSAKLTLIVAATLPAYALLALIVTPALRKRLHDKFNRGADNQAYLVESVSGIQTLKAAAVEPSAQRRWEERLAAYVSASFDTANLSNIANQCASFINKLMILGILWLGAQLVIAGEMTVGMLVAFNMLAGRISGPILRLVQLWQDFQQAGVSVQRLGDILNETPEPTHNHSRSALPAVRGHVRLEHVTFRYRPGAPEVLSDCSLEALPGEVVGIVGPSGSGKSTLTKLIQRLYVPQSGRVLVDGVELSMVHTDWLRRKVGVVLQENVLFNRTIRENIALADPGIPVDKIVRAAQLAGAHDFILELEHGYDQVVGEQGSNLSGGQRQRIAIARALVTDPKILVLDEATSALDYESEVIVQRNLAQICKGRTVFIIAHRLSAVRIASRILVIKDGRVTEAGTHEDLIRSGGYYAGLYRHQAGLLPQSA